MPEQADKPTPANADAFELVRFYYDRGLARSLLGRYQDALTDPHKALEAAKGRLELREVACLRQFQGLQYVYMGDPKRALDVFLAMAREVDRPGVKGWLFNTYRWISWNLLRFGDVDRAGAYLRKAQALMGEARSWPAYPVYGNSWHADIEEQRHTCTKPGEDLATRKLRTGAQRSSSAPC